MVGPTGLAENDDAVPTARREGVGYEHDAAAAAMAQRPRRNLPGGNVRPLLGNRHLWLAARQVRGTVAPHSLPQQTKGRLPRSLRMAQSLRSDRSGRRFARWLRLAAALGRVEDLARAEEFRMPVEQALPAFAHSLFESAKTAQTSGGAGSGRRAASG